MKLPIFLDNHSTTPMDPRVLEAMLPYFVEKFGNAASRNHAFGWAAEEAVEEARKRIARLIKADTKEIVFTSGATESDNLALKGVLEMYKEKGTHIITSSTEHRAVLDTAKSLEAKGLATVTYLPVDKYGTVNPQDVQSAITDKTILISIMFVTAIMSFGGVCGVMNTMFAAVSRRPWPSLWRRWMSAFSAPGVSACWDRASAGDMCWMGSRGVHDGRAAVCPVIGGTSRGLNVLDHHWASLGRTARTESARSMRRSASSRPSTASDSNTPGEIVLPEIATRKG